MNDLQLRQPPVAKTGMLIRKPAAEVFRAFVDPEVTTKFWFTKSSGPLEAGKRVKWEWEMYGAATNVAVKQLEPNKRIVIEWDGYSGRTTVEWKFASPGVWHDFRQHRGVGVDRRRRYAGSIHGRIR